MTVVWYDSARSVNEAYIKQIAAACGDSLEGATWGGVDVDGNEVEIDPAGMLHGIETQGLWGFCDGERIHAWIAPHVEEVRAVGFLAHELAHLRGADAPPIAAEEEAWAELVRSIAEEALTLLRSRLTPPTPASARVPAGHTGSDAAPPVVVLDEWRVVDKDGLVFDYSYPAVKEAQNDAGGYDRVSPECAPHRVMRVALMEVPDA